MESTWSLLPADTFKIRDEMKLVFGDQLSPLVDLLEAFVEHSLSPKHLTAGGRFT